MSNKAEGNKFEREFCEILSDAGFWAHRLKDDAYGQPADIIAVKNDTAYLIDCKVCSRGKFNLNRIESNQHTAMELWADCGNNEGLFALKLDEEIYILSKHVIDCDIDRSTIDENDMRVYGYTIKEWLTRC